MKSFLHSAKLINSFGQQDKFSTVNRELTFLRYLLNLAADDGRMKLKAETERKSDRIATNAEYHGLTNNPRSVQRVLNGLYETAMRSNELLSRRWESIGQRVHPLRAECVKKKTKRAVPKSA